MGEPTYPDSVKLPAAFPSVCLGDPNHPASIPGMTLRDYFAGQALGAIIAGVCNGQHHPRDFKDDKGIEECMAGDAYRLADAMLAERARRHD